MVVNTPLNTITIITTINNNNHIKVDDFLGFFSTVNFSYEYLLKAKVYLKPSRTSIMELFCENIFCKIHKRTPLPESLFNKVIERSLSSTPATSLKEIIPTQMFSDELCQVLKTTFLQNTSRQLLLFYEKIVKIPLRKEKKIETVRKTTIHAKQKLYLHQPFISFY